MTPKEFSAADQAFTELANLLPGAVALFYQGCIERSFSEYQALELTKTYLKAIIMRPSTPTEE